MPQKRKKMESYTVTRLAISEKGNFKKRITLFDESYVSQPKQKTIQMETKQSRFKKSQKFQKKLSRIHKKPSSDPSKTLNLTCTTNLHL